MVSGLAMVRSALGQRSRWRRHLPPALMLLALGALLFSLARPQMRLTAPSNQRMVLLAMDVSGSMRAADVKPTRMEAAQAAAREFVKLQPASTRIGIVTFAGTAALVQPPTYNKDDLIAAIITRSNDHIVGLYAEIRAAGLEPVARFEALTRATLENFHQYTDEAQIFYDNPVYVAKAPALRHVRDDARANDRLWGATIEETLAAGRLRPDIEPARLKVLLRNMIWSTTRGLRRGKTATELSDEVITLLLHGCLVD